MVYAVAAEGGHILALLTPIIARNDLPIFFEIYKTCRLMRRSELSFLASVCQRFALFWDLNNNFSITVDLYGFVWIGSQTLSV